MKNQYLEEHYTESFFEFLNEVVIELNRKYKKHSDKIEAFMRVLHSESYDKQTIIESTTYKFKVNKDWATDKFIEQF